MVSIAATLGVGSGIDTTKLIADLATASRDPKIAAIDRRSTQNAARISALAQVKSDLDSFARSFSNLVAGGSLRTQPGSSDANRVGVAPQNGARLDALDSVVDVRQLAKGQTIIGAYRDTVAAVVGQGTLTLSIAGVDHSVTLDAAHDSLSGLASAINATASGVTARVLQEGGGARLVLKGPPGSSNAFSLTATSGDAGLAAFEYPSATATMSLAQAAQDAYFTVDDIAFVRANNEVSDVVPGVTLTLKSADPGTLTKLYAISPNATIKQTLEDFMSAFNTLKKDLGLARSSVGGDQGLRGLDQRLSALVQTAASSDPLINRLADVGFGTARNGTIIFDATKFEAVIQKNPMAVEALFHPTRDATHTPETDPGLAGLMSQLADSSSAEGGPFSALKRRLDTEGRGIEKARGRVDSREAAYRDRLTRQFGGMDARVATLKATQNYLQQQVAIWTR
jgi:flagellar hook-associated protein 2